MYDLNVTFTMNRLHAYVSWCKNYHIRGYLYDT